MSRRKRGLLSIARAKPRRVYQSLAVDEFGDLAIRKREAIDKARGLNHQMGAWHRRPNDPHGRYNCFCMACNRPAVVCADPPEGLADVYGKALTEECTS